MAIISKTDDEHVKIAALGQGFAINSMIGFGVIIGLSDVLVTLSSQAVGAKEYEVCGVYYQRSQLINIVTFIALLPVNIFSESWLIGMG